MSPDVTLYPSSHLTSTPVPWFTGNMVVSVVRWATDTGHPLHVSEIYCNLVYASVETVEIGALTKPKKN